MPRSEPWALHSFLPSDIDDCTTSEGTTRPISSHDARVALTDPSTHACASCRPDSALGILD
ncbi:DUF6233 domain-containing protein [Streptomyces sp. NPDC003480]